MLRGCARRLLLLQEQLSPRAEGSPQSLQCPAWLESLAQCWADAQVTSMCELRPWAHTTCWETAPGRCFLKLLSYFEQDCSGWGFCSQGKSGRIWLFPQSAQEQLGHRESSFVHHISHSPFSQGTHPPFLCVPPNRSSLAQIKGTVLALTGQNRSVWNSSALLFVLELGMREGLQAKPPFRQAENFSALVWLWKV